MKPTFKHFSAIGLIAFLSLFLSSCSTSNDVVSNRLIQKRKYNKGWHIKNRNLPKGNDAESLAKNPPKSIESNSEDIETTYAYAGGDLSGDFASIISNEEVSTLSASENSPCDVIVLNSGDEIEAKVLEVGLSEVKYKMCDNPDGPTFIESRTKIFMIKYQNGTKTVLKGEEAKEEPKQTTVHDSSPQAKEKRDLDENDYIDTFSSNDKSWVVAVVLWLFLGVIGIHRFYLGYIGLGVLYLLTAGFCGIGWIVDGILFATGGLKPKNGDYLD